MSNRPRETRLPYNPEPIDAETVRKRKSAVSSENAPEEVIGT
jgi:hypothetical protein